MKILALSLLRIGDFFQQVHLFQQVLTQFPKGELHLVCFSDIKGVEKLYPNWKFHFIPRNAIQRELVERDRPWYRGLYLMEESLHSVFSTEWQLVLNPTNSSFSARLMDCIQGADKRGTQFKDGQTAGWNQELHYLNDYYRSLPKPEETWIEITSKALGFSLPPAPPIRLREQGEIWLNPLTSDSRKNWPFANWKSLANIFVELNHKVRILGSPGERDWIAKHFPKVNCGAWSFSELRDQAENCRLLISGDTSVPHLLALERVPMITLFLGPANTYKTSPRLSGISNLCVKVPCGPCEHRGTCSQPTQICEDSIRVREVVQVAQVHLQERPANQVILGPEVFWIDAKGERHEKESVRRGSPSRGSTSTMAG